MCNDPTCPGHGMPDKPTDLGLLLMINADLPSLSEAEHNKLQTLLATETETRSPGQKHPTLHQALKTVYAATNDTSTRDLLGAQHTVVDTWATKFAPVANAKGVLVLSAQFWDDLNQGHTCGMNDAQRVAKFAAALKSGGYDGGDWTSFKGIAFPLHKGNDWFAVLVANNEVHMFDPTGRMHLEDLSELSGDIASHFSDGHAKGTDPACFEVGSTRVTLRHGSPPSASPARHSAVLALVALELWADDLASACKTLVHLVSLAELFIDEHIDAEMEAGKVKIARNKNIRKAQVKKAMWHWTQPVAQTEKEMLDRVAWVCYTGEKVAFGRDWEVKDATLEAGVEA